MTTTRVWLAAVLVAALTTGITIAVLAKSQKHRRPRLDAVPPIELPSRTEALLREGDLEVLITHGDAKAMRLALLDALQRSELGDRNTLLATATPLPTWIDSDGRVSIAGWTLQIRHQRLVAIHWLSRDQDRAVGYSAEFAKENGDWRVTKIVPEKIRFRE